MTIFTQSLSLLAQSDSFAVIEFLDQQKDPLEVAQAYAELVKHAYWKEKDVPAVVALARAGIQYALAAGTLVSKRDLQLTLQLRSEAKAIAYNLASYTWIGWDEPGITLSGSDQRHGLEAARTNLRLAFELDKGDLRISRGYWMKAAQLLAAGDLAAARLGFQKAVIYAARAQAEADRLLSRGFECLVDCLQNPQNREARQALADVKVRLEPLEHGPNFIDQIDTAWRVFSCKTRLVEKEQGAR